MTVRENLEFPLSRVLEMNDQQEIDKRVEEVLNGVGLLDAIDKLPYNFLLRGFFNKKKKAAKAKQNSIEKAQKEKQKATEKAAK
ncbi:MAG: hypothetical protein AAGC65_12365 [Mucilaginibacter sp.]|uniref:hypothetical protein n=1 Tax=Mucilaginibacter sp. TaxID=1882438 RepID=UPI0031A05397